MRYKVGNRVSFLEHESFGNFKQIEGTIIKRNGGIFETQFTEYWIQLEDDTITKVKRYDIVRECLPIPKKRIPMPNIKGIGHNPPPPDDFKKPKFPSRNEIIEQAKKKRNEEFQEMQSKVEESKERKLKYFREYQYNKMEEPLYEALEPPITENGIKRKPTPPPIRTIRNG